MVSDNRNRADGLCVRKGVHGLANESPGRFLCISRKQHRSSPASKLQQQHQGGPVPRSSGAVEGHHLLPRPDVAWRMKSKEAVAFRLDENGWLVLLYDAGLDLPQVPLPAHVRMLTMKRGRPFPDRPKRPMMQLLRKRGDVPADSRDPTHRIDVVTEQPGQAGSVVLVSVGGSHERQLPIADDLLEVVMMSGIGGPPVDHPTATVRQFEQEGIAESNVANVQSYLEIVELGTHRAGLYRLGEKRPPLPLSGLAGSTRASISSTAGDGPSSMSMAGR